MAVPVLITDNQFYLSESDWLVVDDVCVYAYLTSKVLRTMLSHDLTDYMYFQY